MKPTFNTIMARAAMTLLALTITTSSWAQVVGGSIQTDFISEVRLIGGAESTMNEMKENHKKWGWTIIDQNLNEGTKGNVIYLAYKTANIYSTFDFTFVTDFYISTASGDVPDELTIDGRTYHLVDYSGNTNFSNTKGNLNSNAGGDNIHLYYTQEYGTYKDAISRILIDNDPSYAMGKNGESTGYNLNNKAGGSKIYMHVSHDQVFGWNIMKNYHGDLCMVTGYDGPTDDLTTLIIPRTIENSTVESFNMNFSDFTNIDTLCFHYDAGVTEMPVMKGCSKLKKILLINGLDTLNNRLPFSITKIPSYAFSGTAIDTVRMENVTSVEEKAFENCPDLTWVSFGKAASIAVDAFANIKRQCTVVYPGPMSDWNVEQYKYSPGICIKGPYWSCGWEGGIDENDHNRLFWTLDTDGHFTIDCYDDTWETYPQATQGHHWLWDSPFIKSITLNHVDTISENAFENCYNLTSLTIPNDVKSFKNNAFKGCSGLTSITVVGGNPNYDSRNNCNAIIETASNTLIIGCKNTVIPDNVTAIGDSAYFQCLDLTSVTIPSSMTRIGENVFCGCKSVTDVYCYADPSTLFWDGDDMGDFKDRRETICHVYDASDWSCYSRKVNVTFVGDLPSIADNADNSTALNKWNGKKVNLMLKGRTLYLDDDWNTLCLPFNVDVFDGTPLEGFTVKQLDTETACDGHKTGVENGTLYLNFKDATSITAGQPYIVKRNSDLVICSEADWNTFAQNVNKGASYEGKVVRLGADISVSTMASGTFKGTFEGYGHTINLNLSGGGQGLALFYTIDGATIQNVKVTGTVTSSYHRPATFAAFVEGSSTIKNCWSSVAIVSAHNNAWIDGGAFVSRVASGVTLTMTNCAFIGSVTYNPNTYSGGSMVGFSQAGAKVNLTNCLYSPTSLALTAVAYNPHIFVSGDERGNLANCYYNAVAKASILEEEGIDGSIMSTSALAEALGNNWEVSGGNVLSKCIPDINNPIFDGVTINSAAPTVVASEDGKVQFVGNYAPIGVGNEDNTMLFLGEDNTIRHPNAAMGINACHAYFYLPDGMGNPRIGDVNGDGQVSVTDVMAMVGYVLGSVDSGFVAENADINGDGQISVTDVMALVNKILQGDQSITDIVVNGADGIVYDGGGNGPARASRK